jgi:DNA-directed RNA polymerase specialized sigma24 family protein
MLCGDAESAEDLVQTALEKAYLRWDRIELEDPFAYVRQAVVNQHLSWLRRRPWREWAGGSAAELEEQERTIGLPRTDRWQTMARRAA